MAPARSWARTRAAAMLRHAVYVDGVSGRSEDGRPGRDGRVLVVEPVVRLAEAEQGGGRDGRVVEADDPLEMGAGVGEVARGQEVAATLEQRSAATSPGEVGRRLGSDRGRRGRRPRRRPSGGRY